MHITLTLYIRPCHLKAGQRTLIIKSQVDFGPVQVQLSERVRVKVVVRVRVNVRVGDDGGRFTEASVGLA